MAKTQTGGIESSTPFLVTLPIYVVLFVLELIILIHFIFKSSKSKIRALFKRFVVVLIIIILITIFVELWSIVIDFSSRFPRSNGYCFCEMYLRILSFILLEAIMFLYWIIRIDEIFKQSTFALSRKLVKSIFIIIPTLVAASMILLAINMDTKYYLVNTSFNSSVDYGHGCIVEVYHNGSKTVKSVLIIGQILAFAMNIFYGLLFYNKLHQFQRTCATAIKASARAKNGKPTAIDLLMQKHTLLAVISSLCSICVYVVFNILVFGAETPSDNIKAFQFGFLFIDIDMFIKSITMLLMFSIYTRKFYKLCWICIKISSINYAIVTKCKQLNCCNEIDPDDFDKEIPLFLKLNKKAAIERRRIEEIDDDKYHFDKKTYSARDLDVAIGTEFYIVKKIPFKYKCALIKVYISEKTQKIYHYAVNKSEKLTNTETIFKQIQTQKVKKQSLTRHRNEVAKYGYFKDSNPDNISSGVSKHNFYFRKNSKDDCKYPFTVALKLNAHKSHKNGDLIARYVQERIRDSINDVKKIEKIKYEPLLKGIMNEVKTKKMNKNVLFKRCYKPGDDDDEYEKEEKDEKKITKQKSTKTSLSLNMVKHINNSANSSGKKDDKADKDDKTVKKQKSIKTSFSLNMIKRKNSSGKKDDNDDKKDKKDKYASVAPKSPTIEEEEDYDNAYNMNKDKDKAKQTKKDKDKSGKKKSTKTSLSLNMVKRKNSANSSGKKDDKKDKKDKYVSVTPTSPSIEEENYGDAYNMKKDKDKDKAKQRKKSDK